MLVTIDHIDPLRKKYQAAFEEMTLLYGMDSYLLSYFSKVKLRLDVFEKILENSVSEEEVIKDLRQYIRLHPEEEKQAIEKEIDDIKLNYLKN